MSEIGSQRERSQEHEDLLVLYERLRVLYQDKCDERDRAHKDLQQAQAAARAARRRLTVVLGLGDQHNDSVPPEEDVLGYKIIDEVGHQAPTVQHHRDTISRLDKVNEAQEHQLDVANTQISELTLLCRGLQRDVRSSFALIVTYTVLFAVAVLYILVRRHTGL